ncbi:hypothetical protein OIU74_020878 [Salix koriyanagi]|uniref:Uncharacterized protein n=1 Tax=Salix koriyanagi TaxID=2511006 RepID=A0A9Q0P6W4_9ROSI|nr:hypothetical protein OIU74_020878 [Salix koriyanagi]
MIFFLIGHRAGGRSAKDEEGWPWSWPLLGSGTRLLESLMSVLPAGGFLIFVCVKERVDGYGCEVGEDM